ncbi:MAG: hypothetical protein IPN34_04960 [Planctomycetes bacterium]|nr:hypothetical protein [Planctomycetota bacterium]
MSARARTLAAARVLGLACLALLFAASFHHRVAFGPQTFALAGTLGGDPVQHGVPRVVHDPYASSGQFEPWLDHQFREEERHGEAPRWNPWQGLGAPFLANAQTAVYHPVRWVQELLPPPWRFDVAVLIHFATAALGMWLLLAQLGLERLSCALGAIAFSCSGYLVFFANMVHLGAEALLPWHVLAIELVWRGRRTAGALIGGGSFALSHVAGFPESTALCAMLALLWLLARVLHSLGARRAMAWLSCGAALLVAAWFSVGGASSNAERIARGNAAALAAALWIAALCLVPRVTRARCFVLAMALLAGTLIASPALLPFLEFLFRAQHLHGGERWSGTTGFELATARGLAFPNLERYGAGMNAGYAYGEPPYVGALVIGLGLLAPILARTTHPARKSALLFLALALLVTAKLFLLAPVQWLGEVPPLREIIARKYLGVGLAFAWAGSAACGLAALRAQSAARASFLVLGLGAAALYAARTIDAGWAIASWRWLLSTPLLVCAGWLAVGGLAFVALRRSSRPRLAAISAALLLLGVAAELYLDAPRKRASRELAYAAPKGLARWTERLRGERVIGVDGVLPPNLATRYEIQDLRFLDALVEAGIYRYLDARFELPLRDRWDGPAREARLPDPVELDHLGIRWMLAPRRWLTQLQELRVDLAIAAAEHGIRRLAEGPNRGLRLPPERGSSRVRCRCLGAEERARRSWVTTKAPCLASACIAWARRAGSSTHRAFRCESSASATESLQRRSAPPSASAARRGVSRASSSRASPRSSASRSSSTVDRSAELGSISPKCAGTEVRCLRSSSALRYASRRRWRSTIADNVARSTKAHRTASGYRLRTIPPSVRTSSSTTVSRSGCPKTRACA